MNARKSRYARAAATLEVDGVILREFERTRATLFLRLLSLLSPRLRDRLDRRALLRFTSRKRAAVKKTALHFRAVMAGQVAPGVAARSAVRKADKVLARMDAALKGDRP
jgi:hypothetical protein